MTNDNAEPDSYDVIGSNMIKAVREGDIEAVKWGVVKHGLSYCKEWRHGYDLLKTALLYRKDDVAELLLASGARVNYGEFSTRETTLLHIAARRYKAAGDVIFETLLSRGANVDKQDEFGNTPMHYAACIYQTSPLCIDYSLNLNAVNRRGETPLHIAVKSGNVDFVLELVGKGASVDVGDHRGETPLHIVTHSGGSVEIACLLLPLSSNVNAANVDGDTPLHIAIKCSNMACVKLLLKENASVDVRNNSGSTPLHIAASLPKDRDWVGVNCREKIAALVLPRSSDVNAINKYGDTPLHIALKYKCNSKELLSLFLKRGASVDIGDKAGTTPLHLSVNDTSSFIFPLLLSYSTNVNATNKKGETCLHLAVERCKKDFVEMLLSQNAFVDTVDQSGSTPLHIAAAKSAEIAELLVPRSSNVNLANGRGETALHVAIRKGYLMCTTLLLAQGANLNICDNAGNSPLHIAVQRNDLECSRFLLSKGATADYKNGSDLTPLHIAAVDRRAVDIARLLVPLSCVNARNDDGETALHIAARRSNEECVKLLLNNDASVDVLDKRGCTPLYYAAHLRNTETAELLVHSANVNAANNIGETPLHVSAKGHRNVIELLLRRDAVIDARDKSGSTPLHYAAECNDLECAKLLIAHNAASVKATNNCGETPLHVAIKYSSYDSNQIFLSNANLWVLRASRESKNRLIEFVNFLLNNGADVNAKNDDGATALALSVVKAYDEVVKTLLERGADVEVYVDKETGMTVLHHAVGKSHHADIQALLERRSSVGAEVKNSAPGYNVQLHREMVKMLVGKGCDVNTKTHKSMTPLHFSAAQEDICISELLLRNGADINAVCDTKQLAPLHVAVLVGCEKMVSFLLEHGASVDALDEDGNTALFKAVTLEHATNSVVPDIVDCILKHSPNMSNESNRKCLKAAVECGAQDEKSASTIEKLFEYGFEIQSDDQDDIMLLHVAVRKGYGKFVEKMLKCSSDSASLVNSVCGEDLMTALHVAAKHSSWNMVTYLLTAGADVNVKDGNNNTPLFYTNDEKAMLLLDCYNQKIEKCPDIFFTAAKRCQAYPTLLVKRLLESGVDVNAENSDGKTALMLACSNCNDMAVGLLLKYNADVNIKDTKTGYTALHFCASTEEWCNDYYERGSVNDIFAALLFSGADINSESIDEPGDVSEPQGDAPAEVSSRASRKTALYVAVERGNVRNVDILLRYGADINFKCGDFTPLMWAKKVYSTTLAGNVSTEETRYKRDYMMIGPGDHVDVSDEASYLSTPGFSHTSVYSSIKGLFLKHIHLMLAAGLSVNEKDFRCVCSDMSNDLRYDVQLLIALEELKETRTRDGKLSSYDVLVKKPNALAVLCKNKKYTELPEVSFRNPFYEIVNHRLYLAIDRVGVLGKATCLLEEVFALPYLCVNIISDNLSNADLRSFIKACEFSEMSNA